MTVSDGQRAAVDGEIQLKTTKNIQLVSSVLRLYNTRS